MRSVFVRAIQAIVITLLAVAMSGCDKSVRTVWTKVVKNCAENDLDKDLIKTGIFMGPSSNLGPGTIFRRYSDKSYQPSVLPIYLDGKSGLINGGNFTSCKGKLTTSFNLNGKFESDQVIGTPLTLQAALKVAKTVDVTINQWRKEELVLGPYEALISGMSDSEAAKSALVRKGDAVLAKALQVKGFTAKLTFSTEVSPSLKASIPAKVATTNGNGVELSATWKSDRELELTTDTEFYLAGQLRKWDEVSGGLAAGGATRLTIVPDQGSATVSREMAKD